MKRVSRLARRTADTLLEELEGLDVDPVRQRDFAFELLTSNRRPSIFLPALTIVGDPRNHDERDAMLSLYGWLNEGGTTRDLNAGTRIRILKALRSAELHAPLDILLRAVHTVEHAPPGGLDEAAGLRAAALVSLVDINDELAGYHAARLLVDHETSQFSGEPAVTAATVLATLSRLEPLYAYVMRTPQGQSEVIAEALHALVGAPETIVREVVEHLLAFDDEPVVASVFELVLRRDDQQWTALIRSFLAGEQRPNLHRYVATTVAAERRPWQIDLLRERVAIETAPKRLAILAEALSLFDPELVNEL